MPCRRKCRKTKKVITIDAITHLAEERAIDAMNNSEAFAAASLTPPKRSNKVGANLANEITERIDNKRYR